MSGEFAIRKHTVSTFGPSYDESLDGARVRTQMERIRDYMLEQRAFLSLAEIAHRTGYPEASVSAQLRHLRKPQFGRYEVLKRRRGETGTWEYQVRPPRPMPTAAQPSLFEERRA